MLYENMTWSQKQDAIALAEARILRLDVGSQFTVKFTARGVREARITRIGKAQQRFFQSYDKTNRCWGRERKLSPHDLIR